jgi:hypothetical protein
MSKTELIQKTLQTLEKLPSEKVGEVTDFAEYLLQKFEEESLRKGIQLMVTESETFNFLMEEQEIYSVKDLKETYS